MGDLKRPRVIYLKGILFLVSGVLSFGLILADSPHWRTLCLLSLCVWSFCRCYYFVFYVIQHYVDDGYRFAGLWNFAAYCRRRSRAVDDRQVSRKPGVPDR